MRASADLYGSVPAWGQGVCAFVECVFGLQVSAEGVFSCGGGGLWWPADYSPVDERALAGGRAFGVAGLWGANTPSWRLTCDILSQPKLSRRTRAHYFREPRASPKGHRRTIGGYTNGLYKDHVRCGPDAAGVTGRVDRSSSSCAVVPGQP